MQTSRPNGLVRGAVVAVAIALLIALFSVPAPGSKPKRIRGTVVRSDLVQGSKGPRGFLVVHLDDGSVVSLQTSSSELPVMNSLITVEEEYGIFGQRFISRH